MPLTENDQRLLELFRNPLTREYGFSLIVKEFQQPVYWMIRRMLLNHDDANDLTQDTFVSVWLNLDRFRGESKLFTWIYRIAWHECLAFLEKKKKQAKVPFDDVAYKLANELEEDPYFRGDEIQRRLQTAIQSLPPQQRIIFTMRYYDNLKYEDMSRILKLTTGALKASYHHAVKKIEKMLGAD